MTPFTAPPTWPEVRPGRFAGTIARGGNSPNAEQEAYAAGCRIALIGLADDTGVSMNFGRVGAKQGPAAFRAALAKYGVASPAALPGWHSTTIATTPARPLPVVYDAGDVAPGADLDETHRRVTAAVKHLADIGFLLIGIGGGHDLTFPFVRGVIESARGKPALNGRAAFHGVYLDAHLDVRAEPGSGMPFRKLVEECGVARLTCVGVDPFANAPEHVEWFASHGGHIVFTDDTPAYDAMAPAGTNVFVSIDLDCLDAAHAPGVSAINPCGFSPTTVAHYAREAGRSAAVRCFDIMELNPTMDQDNRTARVAARLFLEFVTGFAERL